MPYLVFGREGQRTLLLYRMRVHITARSGNAKTGPIPVTTTERTSCPTTCPFYDKGCYAKSGPLAFHWRKVSDGERGTDWQGLTSLSDHYLSVSYGDTIRLVILPHTEGQINSTLLGSLVKANRGKRGFTYTHHVLNNHNTWLIEVANQFGFTVNVSTESKDDAVAAFNKGLPAVVRGSF